MDSVLQYKQVQSFTNGKPPRRAHRTRSPILVESLYRYCSSTSISLSQATRVLECCYVFAMCSRFGFAPGRLSTISKPEVVRKLCGPSPTSALTLRFHRAARSPLLHFCISLLFACCVSRQSLRWCPRRALVPTLNNNITHCRRVRKKKTSSTKFIPCRV